MQMDFKSASPQAELEVDEAAADPPAPSAGAPHEDVSHHSPRLVGGSSCLRRRSPLDDGLDAPELRPHQFLEHLEH